MKKWIKIKDFYWIQNQKKTNQSTNRDILFEDTNKVKTINVKYIDSDNSDKNVIIMNNNKEDIEPFQLNLININIKNLKNIDRKNIKPIESNVILNIYDFYEAKKIWEKKYLNYILYIFNNKTNYYANNIL